jgi:meso-butanediol dehydrogenase / (S,S)-butanediol dehydrogenase / diacetyl reductase
MRMLGKVTIITGAASGIGRATAILFGREGAKVVVADRDLVQAKEVATEIAGAAIAVGVDVSNKADVVAMVEETLKHFARIDVLVNNAGYGIPGTVLDVEERDWDALMSVNLKGVYLCSKHVLPVMVRQREGVIVNTGSYTANTAITDRAAYVASKGGVVALSRAMALDHIGAGIRVNCVAPGTISSPYFDKMLEASGDPADMRRALDARAPIGRMGEPEEIARAILFLASDESSFAVGSVLTVDGGTTAW